MTLIEVLQPEGRMQVYMTEQRNAKDIALEVEELYPDATVWRKSKDWRLTGSGRPADGIPQMSSTLRTVLIVVALALILTPVITWATTFDGAQIFGQSSGGTRQRGGPGTSDATDLDTLSGEVIVANVVEQTSDSSMTLQVWVRNEDEIEHEDIQVSVVFLDSSGVVVPVEDGGNASISLAPGEEGFVKLWAHNDGGVAEYEVAIVD